MLKQLLFGLFSVVVFCICANAQPVPQYRQYSTEPSYFGPHAAPDLSSPDAYNFRTRLRLAASQPANFAGHYRLELWGCGTSCISGAAVNLRNGRVVFLPFSICCSAKATEPNFEPVEFRPNSRLIVFGGLRNENPPDAAHFYEFTGAGFSFLMSSRPFQHDPDRDAVLTKNSSSKDMVQDVPQEPTPIEQNQTTIFDRPALKKVIPLPPDPLNPTIKAALSCFYYPNFMVKQVDLGEKGAEQLSIITTAGIDKIVPCQRENINEEMVITGRATDPWSGYFKGTKGRYAFFDADDGYNGGVPFAIYDGIDSKKIFDDSTLESIKSIDVDNYSIILKYKRVYAAPCSMLAEKGDCWHTITQATGLATDAKPDCIKAYKSAVFDAVKNRPDADKQAIMHQTTEIPTVLHYDVVVTISGAQKTFIHVGPPPECFLSD